MGECEAILQSALSGLWLDERWMNAVHSPFNQTLVKGPERRRGRRSLLVRVLPQGGVGELLLVVHQVDPLRCGQAQERDLDECHTEITTTSTTRLPFLGPLASNMIKTDQTGKLNSMESNSGKVRDRTSKSDLPKKMV